MTAALHERMRVIHESITNITRDIQRRGALPVETEEAHREFVAWRGRAQSARRYLRAERREVWAQICAAKAEATERHARKDREKLRELALLAWHVVRATEAQGMALSEAERDLLRAAQTALPHDFAVGDAPSSAAWRAEIARKAAEFNVMPLRIHSSTTLVRAEGRMYSVETDDGAVADVSALDTTTEAELTEVHRVAHRIAAVERDHNFALLYRAVHVALAAAEYEASRPAPASDAP